MGCLLVFFDCFFGSAEALDLDEVPQVHFFFCFSYLWRCVMKKVSVTNIKEVKFSSRIVMDSCLTLRSFIHLEFIFVHGVRE